MAAVWLIDRSIHQQYSRSTQLHFNRQRMKKIRKKERKKNDANITMSCNRINIWLKGNEPWPMSIKRPSKCWPQHLDWLYNYLHQAFERHTSTARLVNSDLEASVRKVRSVWFWVQLLFQPKQRKSADLHFIFSRRRFRFVTGRVSRFQSELKNGQIEFNQMSFMQIISTIPNFTVLTVWFDWIGWSAFWMHRPNISSNIILMRFNWRLQIATNFDCNLTLLIYEHT